MPRTEMCQSSDSKKPDSDLRSLTDEAITALVVMGDRSAAAEFIRRNEGVIRARYRWKIRRQPERIADTDDLLSTVFRRVDRFVAGGRLSASGPGRLFEFINRVADRASGEILRRSVRSHRKHNAAPTQTSRAAPMSDPPMISGLLEQAQIHDRDRLIIRMRLAGLRYRHIAHHLGITDGLARERYRIAVRRLTRAAVPPVDEKER